MNRRIRNKIDKKINLGMLDNILYPISWDKGYVVVKSFFGRYRFKYKNMEKIYRKALARREIMFDCTLYNPNHLLKRISKPRPSTVTFQVPLRHTMNPHA